MARPVKRPPSDSEDEAKADHSPTASKRPRASPPLSDGHHDDGSIEDEEMMGDEVDELVDEEDQSIYDMSRSNGGGMEAEMGVIEKISLTNFMCHDRLEVRLGSKLNFVIGHNGSGKSAILTAITIALGGKATATSRGNSLKSFVKEGKQAAIVEVTLKNQGPEAFRYKEYGDKIIVERMIRADGTGSWKTKDHMNRIVSVKREELNAICDHANIQVDNPMNILTQDAARSFLSGSHSDEKYQFFLRGTQLAQLASEYDIVQANMQRIRLAVGRGEEALPALAEKAREANSQLEVLQRARNQKDQIQTLRSEIVWAYVAEKEDEWEEVLLRSERQTNRRKKVESELAKCKEEEEKHEATISEFEQKTGENAERETPLLLKMKELKEQERLYHREIVNAQQEKSTLNDQYKRLKLQIDGLLHRIEVETRRSKDGNHGKRTALLNQQRQDELEKKKLEKEEADEKDRSGEYDREVGQIDREISLLEGKRDHYRSILSHNESLLRRMEGVKTNRLTAFGQNIPVLLNLIDRETRWRQKPVGPIGNHVKLTDGKWAPVLESVLGNTLNGFCVTSAHDRNLLQELKRRANCVEIPILTGSDEAFDYSGGEPESNVLTILRVLQIENGFLTRQLINAVHIEQSALVTARVEGDRLMRKKLRNVKACFSMDMYRLGGGNVGSSTQSLQSHNGPPRLSMDIEGQAREAREKQRDAQEHVIGITREIETYQLRRNAALESRRESRQRIPAIQRQARQKHAEIERIDEELREDEPTNIAALVEAKKDAELEQEKIQEKIQTVLETIDFNEKKMKPFNEERLKMKAKVETMQEQSKTLIPMLEEAAKSRLQAHKSGLYRQAQLEEAITKEEDLKASAKTLENEVTSRTKRAEEHCERVPTTKSSKEYEKEIESVEQQILAATRLHGQDPEAVTLLVKQCSADFQKAQADIEVLKEVYADLKEAVDIRLRKWRLFRRTISVRAKNSFAHYLNNRGYNGNIHFDHNKGTLKLSVQTDETSGPRPEKDPKSLSGGEKSFSTVSLLLALWESIGCPIRCLDEFDVFMDAVNRKISMSMMIEAARGANGVQYVLITPQAMSNVNLGSDVRVIRLRDPERNQTTLD
ncbi:hypothetical protein CBS101457_001609 [Exobasidium rhododendri]|nr:hypothetical protein CBS101457_001609 [Exobasidium rhododendri]